MDADDLSALCERLSRGFEDAGEFTVVVDKADLRAAIAAIRALEQVETAAVDVAARWMLAGRDLGECGLPAALDALSQAVSAAD